MLDGLVGKTSNSLCHFTWQSVHHLSVPAHVRLPGELGESKSDTDLDDDRDAGDEGVIYSGTRRARGKTVVKRMEAYKIHFKVRCSKTIDECRLWV